MHQEYWLFSFEGKKQNLFSQKGFCFFCFLLFIFFFGISTPLSAQFPTQTDREFDEFGQDTTKKELLTQEGVNRLLLPDTAVLYYFHANELNETKTQFDTTLNNVWKYSPARRQQLPYAVAGILGAASVPMFYQEAERRGTDIGFHQYDLYRKDWSDLRFYENSSGYTKARFAAVGNDQADGFLETTWGRKFEDGYYFSADINRIFQTGQQKHFENQGVKQYNFTVGAGYDEPDNPYKAFLIYSSNSTEALESGGAYFVDSLRGETELPLEESVNTESGTSRQSIQEASFIHYLAFSGKADSSGRKRNYTASHELHYAWSDFRFSEPNPATAGRDSTYYAAFPYDFRGIRFYLEHQKVQNKITLQTFKNNKKKGKNDLLKVGIDHQYHHFRYAPDTFSRNNLFVFGNWKIEPSKSLKFDALAHFGVLDNAGDYRLEGNAEVKYGDWGKLTGSFVNQLYEPSVVQEKFNLTFQNIWDEEDFKKTLSTSIKGNLEIPKLKLNVGVNYHLLNNYIYYDTLAYARQTEVPISVLQFHTKLNLKLYKFHLDNLVGFQTVSERFLSLPKFYGESSFYFKDYIFKDKTAVKIGVDARLIGSYSPLNYNPLVGQFHLQNSFTIQNYPSLTGFAMLKLKRFQFFIIYENFQELFGPKALVRDYDQRYYFEVGNYPFAGNVIRFGLQWELFE